jgi:hypothetical protein
VRYPYPGGVGIPRLDRLCRLRALLLVHRVLSPTQSRRPKKSFTAEEFSSVKTCSVRGITYPSVSYLSQKVMSEVSYPRGVGVPRLDQPWLLTCTPSFSGPTFKAVEKHERHSGRKDLFPRKISTQRGFPPFSPRGRVGLCRGKADPSLMTRLCV